MSSRVLIQFFSKGGKNNSRGKSMSQFSESVCQFQYYGSQGFKREKGHQSQGRDGCMIGSSLIPSDLECQSSLTTRSSRDNSSPARANRHLVRPNNLGNRRSQTCPFFGSAPSGNGGDDDCR